MRIHIVARNPTDALTEGFLPAAARMGATVTVLTDDPQAHLATYTAPDSVTDGDGQLGAPTVLGCAVTDAHELIDAVDRLGRPDAVFTNSDHLQTQVALAAHYFALPGKDWAATLRTRNKALTRARLAASCRDTVFAIRLGSGEDLTDRPALRLPGPCVVKPRDGVAGEDVALVTDIRELRERVARIRARRPEVPLVVEEFLDGPLRTLETLGDAAGNRRVLGGFATRLSAPPTFIEESLAWAPDLPAPVRCEVLAQLDALGVGLGACHTEFIVQGDRARIVEVNDRLIGDQCDLMVAEMLDEPLFELTLRAHLGEPVAASGGAPPAAGAYCRADYVCAPGDGVLDHAPTAVDAVTAKATLRYRPLRPTGARVTRQGSNRDYLGVVRAVGEDRAGVDRAVEDFLAANTWHLRP